MINHKLNETVIGSARVVVDILPGGRVIPNTRINPTSITIHQTGNVGAIAKNNHNYMKNCNRNGDRIASWHFTVDDKEIYQAQSCNYKTFHAGTAAGNDSSIGIEICMFNDKEKQKKAYDNAIALVKILLSNYGWTIDKVKRHKDWSGKHCPAWLIEGKFGYSWDWFKKEIGAPNSQARNISNDAFTVKVSTDSLNVRKGPSTAHAVVTSIKQGEVYTIVEVNGSWGKLKSGVGWINISANYVKRV